MASTMDALRAPEKDCPTYDPTHVEGQQTAIYVQLVLSLTLGVSAFLGFCVSNEENMPNRWNFANIYRFCDQNGRVYMLRANDMLMLLQICQSFRIPFLVGCLFCIESQKNKYLHLLDWMHMLYVLRIYFTWRMNNTDFN